MRRLSFTVILSLLTFVRSFHHSPVTRNFIRGNRVSRVKERPYLTSIRSKMSKRASESQASSSNKRLRMEDTGNNSSSSNSSSIPFVPSGFQLSRARLITKANDSPLTGDCVVYWMSRDQRIRDNHALHYAQSTALTHRVPLKIVFNLVPKFLEATIRQYGFMIKGLQEVEIKAIELNIAFHLTKGNPVETIPQFVQEQHAMLLVTDFSPLRVGSGWVKDVGKRLDDMSGDHKIPLIQVDAHNIVPCWVASPKLEYSARTFRGKITPKIPEYLKEIPEPINHPHGSPAPERIDWQGALDSLEINRDVKEVDWLIPGETAAHNILNEFITKKLKGYDEKRNDPNQNVASHLSPYLHFGQISAQKVILTLKQANKYGSAADSFIEEAVVRRELTDNFCFYNPNYDNLDGCYDWAKETLNVHRHDKRPVIYTLEQLENAKTHDDLWNAAQIQLNREGKMHGFLRMYWAKKILEWTPSPELALQYSLYLNDKYELDGRDPNGYVGCMWSIGGVHDQGWGERPIFGKIRYMNYDGCKRKFDVKAFVAKYPPAAKNAATAQGQSTIY